MMRVTWILVLSVSLSAGILFGSAPTEAAPREAAKPKVAQEIAAERLESEFRENERPVLKGFCYRCHGAEKKKSDVRVDILDGSLEDQQLYLLKHVLEQLKDEAMPPEKARQPSMAQRRAVIEWIVRALQVGHRKVRAKHGTVRRLTVTQYHNTLRDLLGIEVLRSSVLFVAAYGKDGAPGTAERPLRTLSGAANRAMPGDTILVRAGIDRERVAPPRRGTPRGPITYRGEKLGAVFLREPKEFPATTFYAFLREFAPA